MQNDQGMRGYAIEWPTVVLVVACTGIWMSGVWLIGQYQAWPALPLLACVVTLHSSLQHEAIHGHPTNRAWLNAGLVFPAVGLFLPYQRFQALHILHHEGCELSHPIDDPESPYVSVPHWRVASVFGKTLRRFNNTLAGRLLAGPPVSLAGLIVGDFRRIRSGERKIAWHWATHVPALVPVLIWLDISGVPLWAYGLLVAWPGMSVLMLRTFAEHTWHPDVAARSVTVEHGGVFALLFLNNHLHAAHHHSPGMAWYRLPALSRHLDAEGHIVGERFKSYGQIARRWGLRVRTPLVFPGEVASR